LASRYAPRLAEFAAGLPVQIIPHCAALRLAAERDGVDAAFAALLDEKAKRSFDGAYQLLAPSAKLLAHAAARLNPQRIPRNELKLHMADGAGWQPDTFRNALNACLDFQVVQGTDELRIHQLFSKFVSDTPAPDDVATSLTAIMQTQAARMVEVAQELVAHPDHAGLAALLMVFSPDPAHWCEGDAEVSIADGEVVGRALMEVGVFAAAQPWFERAVQAAQHGDIHGRVDQASLGSSLHQVGNCLSSQGQFAAAQSWYERAVAAREQGDIHGRVDHDDLGGSLHGVGYCLSSQGQFAAAQSWYERAVAAREQGDVHGRVDHDDLGGSLHQMGYCLSSCESASNGDPCRLRLSG
jgi:tetratricopeptide (TPR) repeat protein